MERMTNPCFEDNQFAKVMKGQHVTHDPDESAVGMAESDGEDSGSDKAIFQVNLVMTIQCI